MDVLKNIVSEDKLDKIRLLDPDHYVIGGQPVGEWDIPNDNNPHYDLACTLKFALDELEKIKSAYVKDTLWDRMLSGVIYQTILDTPPEPNIFFLDGSLFDVIQYPKLAVLYPDGILPDLRERYLIGASYTMPVRTKIAQAVLAHTHTAWTNEAGHHNHSLTLNLDRATSTAGNAVYGDENYYGQAAPWTSGAGSHTHAVGVGATGESKQLVDSYAINFMIKGE